MIQRRPSARQRIDGPRPWPSARSDRDPCQHAVAARHGRSRRGKSLIELLVVIAFAGVLTPMCISMIATFFRAESVTITDLNEMLTVNRVARMFRSDLHQAREIELNDAQSLIVQLGSQETIEYLASEGQLVRRRLAAGNLVQREEFRLEGANCRFQQDTAEPRLLQLQLETTRRALNLKNPALPPRSLEIRAYAGALTPAGDAVPENEPESVPNSEPGA